MPIAGGPCPNCGAPIEFRSGSSLTRTCDHCGQFVVRTDVGAKPYGRVADLAATEHSLSVGDRGSYGGRAFEVLGAVILRHPQGGSWEEYNVGHPDGTTSWVVTAQGRWYVVGQSTESVVRPYQVVRVGEPVQLGGYGAFTVVEKNEAVFERAQGELPWAVRPGQILRFVDLSGPGGRWASIHYVREGGMHAVFVGAEVTFDALRIERRGGGAPVQAVPLAQMRCDNCGGDLPARVDPKALRVVCPYCKAISDLALHRIIARQDAARATPKIPLGTKATLQGVPWVVIGYVERSAIIEGERFAWSEYLLYHPQQGYRWLIEDEGVWRFATPVSAGDVAATAQSAVMGGRRYGLRNANVARVDLVLGEFYWQVEVGETVDATDFVSGDEVLSREKSGTEVQWTVARAMPTAPLFRSLGLPVPQGPALPAMGGTGNSSQWVIVALVVLVVCCFVCIAVSGDGGGGYSSGGYAGGHGASGWSGGFGGK